MMSSSINQAVDYVRAVREAADDPRGAYLIRSRLRRALLACARGIAERQGLEKPLLAGQWVATDCAAPQERHVIGICRRVYQRSQTLCQPSESFDVRWEAGWAELKGDLAELESALMPLTRQR